MTAENDATAARRRAVETLAQTFYEANDPGGIPWARRTLIIRDPWLVLADRQLSQTRERSG